MTSHTSKDVAAVISRLIAAGGRFSAEGERLRYSGPAGLLTDEVDRFIGEHKSEALAVIADWQRSTSLDGLDWPLRREITGDGSSYDLSGGYYVA